MSNPKDGVFAYSFTTLTAHFAKPAVVGAPGTYDKTLKIPAPTRPNTLNGFGIYLRGNVNGNPARSFAETGIFGNFSVVSKDMVK